MSSPTPIRQSRNHNTTPESPTPEKARLEHGKNGQAFGVGEDLRRNDFVRAEGLFGIDEGGEDATGLLALACNIVLAFAHEFSLQQSRAVMVGV